MSSRVAICANPLMAANGPRMSWATRRANLASASLDRSRLALASDSSTDWSRNAWVRWATAPSSSSFNAASSAVRARTWWRSRATPPAKTSSNARPAQRIGTSHDGSSRWSGSVRSNPVHWTWMTDISVRESSLRPAARISSGGEPARPQVETSATLIGSPTTRNVSRCCCRSTWVVSASGPAHRSTVPSYTASTASGMEEEGT